MTSDHDMLWRRCAHLGRLLLPVVDEEEAVEGSVHSPSTAGPSASY
ncbi:hypothetical protein ACIO02_23110 [Streptomyces sp. NPDC087568]